MFIGGAVVQWIRDGLGLIRTAADIEPLAAIGPGQRRRLPRAGVRRARRAALGSVRARHDRRHHARHDRRAHRARGAREHRVSGAPICSTRWPADAGIPLTELRVDGGAATNDTLMQFQADLLGVPVVRPAVTETTALGAAYLAGLAVGFWPSVDAITGQWKVDRRFEPAMPRQRDRRRCASAGPRRCSAQRVGNEAEA